MTASSSAIPPVPPSPAFPQSVGIRQKPMAPSALKADWRNTNKSGSPSPPLSSFLSQQGELAALQAGATLIRHFIVSGKPPYKQRRSGIVQRRAPPHGDAVLVGVTIEASVPAGAVHADIHTRHTLAPGPLLRGTDIMAASSHPLSKLTAFPVCGGRGRPRCRRRGLPQP